MNHFSNLTYKGFSDSSINNDVWFRSLTNRGFHAWILALILTGFYILLYFFPEYLGYRESGNTGLIGLFDPLSMWIKNKPASQWFVYGVFYTIAILIFGIKFLLKYRSNPHQKLRTLSVMFFQLAFAFMIPERQKPRRKYRRGFYLFKI